MSEVKRYTAWAAEVALPRGTMVVLAADYDALAAELKALNDEIIDHRNYTKACRDRDEAQKARVAELAAELNRQYALERVAELEALSRVFQTWLGASRDQCDESGQQLWDRIENSLAGQPQQGDHIPDVTKMVDSEECISDEGKCGLGGYCEPCPAKAEQAAAADEQAENAKEAAEILRNMIDTITYHGNYSVESTLNFLNQALGSVNAAISTYRAQSVPDGWVMVPVDPTPAMVSAYLAAQKAKAMASDMAWGVSNSSENFKSGFSAMLAAAPSSQQKEPDDE